MKFSLDVPVERRAVKDKEAVTIDLPFPPSVNAMFANNFGEGRGRYPTKQYKEWQTEAAWRILSQRPGRVPGKVKITLEYEEKGGRRDLDNLIKSVLDALVKHKVIDGDHRSVLREISAKWSGEVRGVRITIAQAKELRRAA